MLVVVFQLAYVNNYDVIYVYTLYIINLYTFVKKLYTKYFKFYDK